MKGRFAMLPATTYRVSENTDTEVNQRIQRQTEHNVAHFADLGERAINRRLAELDHEWDIERCLETMASTFTLTGLGLAITISRKWLALPVLVQSFFLQHALQGWCPPIPLLRRLGVRTATEIEEERFALKALRGDFDSLADATAYDGNRGDEAIAAARK
jgi:hypothetical protein